MFQQHLFGRVEIPMLDDIASYCSDDLQLQQWTCIRSAMLSVAPQRQTASQLDLLATTQAARLGGPQVKGPLLKLVYLSKHSIEELHACCYA